MIVYPIALFAKIKIIHLQSHVRYTHPGTCKYTFLHIDNMVIYLQLLMKTNSLALKLSANFENF